MYLTKRQSQILDYLRKSLASQGYAPSLEETAAHFKLSSVGTVHKHLKALEEKGLIRRQWNRSRAIEIVDMPDGKARRLPLLGRISAGRPIEATADSASVAVPEDMLGRSKAFLLQAKDDSLAHESIVDGDHLVLEQRDQALDGDLVVALVDGEQVAVGRFYRQGDDVQLVASGQGDDPLVLAAARCRVQGIVVGLLRRLA